MLDAGFILLIVMRPGRNRHPPGIIHAPSRREHNDPLHVADDRHLDDAQLAAGAVEVTFDTDVIGPGRAAVARFGGHVAAMIDFAVPFEGDYFGQRALLCGLYTIYTA